MPSINHVLLIISGGIAAYKSLLLIRELKQKNIKVTAVLTDSAHEFVTPLSISALTETKTYSELFDLTDEQEMGHIELSRSADLILVVPATANIIAKMANGIADDLATTLLLATNKPIMVTPSMNVKMWEHAATQRNVKQIIQDGVAVIGPNSGDMACGEFGLGRMSEPLEILDAILNFQQTGPLNGKHVIVTSGPTHESIDPVRYIANRSSGKQGTAVANALISLGATVTFITGPAPEERPKLATIIEVETAKEMLVAVENALPADIAVFVAAVADWNVLNKSDQKIKKTEAQTLPVLEFSENPDILSKISHLTKDRPQLVIGFAAETDNVEEYAKKKRLKKGCDWIIANNVSADTNIMGGDENDIIFITDQETENWPRMKKENVAKLLVEKIVQALK